jgi:hypothetical protein
MFMLQEVDISNQLVNAFQIRVGAAGGVKLRNVYSRLEFGYLTIPVAKIELFNDVSFNNTKHIGHIKNIHRFFTRFYNSLLNSKQRNIPTLLPKRC